jgi:hypothetical protein
MLAKYASSTTNPLCVCTGKFHLYLGKFEQENALCREKDFLKKEYLKCAKLRDCVHWTVDE